MKLLRTLITSAILISTLSVNSSAADHFTEDFTGAFSTTYTDGIVTLGTGDWDVYQVRSEIAANSYGGIGGAARLNDDTPGGSYLTTPVVNTVGTISFYYRDFNGGGGTFTIQKSISGGAFTDVTTQAFSGLVYSYYSYDISDASPNIRIRIVNNNNPGHLIIDDVTLSIITSSPSLSCSVSDVSGFSYIVGSGPSTELSYEISGINLDTTNVIITPPANYEVSLTTGTGFVSYPSVLTLFAFDGTLTTIFVRLKSGLAIGTYNSEIISHIGSGDTTGVSVTCNGEVLPIPPPTLAINPSSLSGFSYTEGSGPSAEQTYTISGSNLDGSNVILSPTTNYELSFTSGTGFYASPTTLTLPVYDGTPTSIYVRLAAGLAAGIYNGEILTHTGGGATQIDLSCDGEVTAISAGACASDLFISEYHEPSSGNNKGIEVYNGTGSPVDLSNYWIGTIANGGLDVESSTNLSGILNDGETVCIYNDLDGDPAFGNQGNINIVWGSASWNGDDAIYLLKGGNTMGFILDAIGDLPPVTDPGTEFIDNGISTLNTTLTRKDFVTSPVTAWSGLEWNEAAAGTYTDWGIHTISCSGSAPVAPTIDSVIITDGNYIIGDTISITIYADSTNYTGGTLVINGQSGAMFTDNGDSTYTFIYVVQEGDSSVTQINDLIVNIILDNSGTLSSPFTGPATGTLTIDATRPILSSAIRDNNTQITVTLSEIEVYWMNT